MDWSKVAGVLSVAASGPGVVVEAQLTRAFAGIAIGVVCSRLVFRRQGYALIAVLGLVMVMLFVKGLPPVNRLFTMMATSSDSAELLAPAGTMVAVAAVFLVASVAATHYLAGRKE
ncbi:hypothetical protein [Streptomyces sp. VB1]|uniref:hypothetical protein n=1 Tax=Streptomyces sp. VB1 TaxID=2986803 RepID=UPI0022424DED|nr:hypothetical protein [Streptomyces sp. VB1]UZI27949.1 hypothetical protein OH133_07325 [Streptomyces sp. VB1]